MSTDICGLMVCFVHKNALVPGSIPSEVNSEKIYKHIFQHRLESGFSEMVSRFSNQLYITHNTSIKLLSVCVSLPNVKCFFFHSKLNPVLYSSIMESR